MEKLNLQEQQEQEQEQEWDHHVSMASIVEEQQVVVGDEQEDNDIAPLH